MEATVFTAVTLTDLVLLRCFRSRAPDLPFIREDKQARVPHLRYSVVHGAFLHNDFLYIVCHAFCEICSKC